MTEKHLYGINTYLNNCFEKYFQPLVAQFQMKIIRTFYAGMGALCDAAAGSRWVRMINDRGIVSFEISSAHGDEQFWDVELICEMYGASTRKLKGNKRLSLKEQAAFIRNHWGNLQKRFSAGQIDDTRKALSKLSARRFFILLISGQILMAIIVSHFGILESPADPITFKKILAAGLVIAGAFLSTG